MIVKNASKKNIDLYIQSLKKVASLSNLYSDSDVAYLNYRSAEKIFCKSFGFKDVSRSDISVDAHNGVLGVGIKTFLKNKGINNYQKIAEFNKDQHLLNGLSSYDKICLISDFRNNRINFAKNLYGLNSFLYHCILRREDVFEIHEIKMDYIDVSNISITKDTGKAIHFEDGNFEYYYSLSKSTLYKNFKLTNPSLVFDVEILEDPEDCLDFSSSNVVFKKIKESIVLPLYGKNKTVYPGSGLNAWNASGRKRDFDEVYIPVPSVVRSSVNTNFFEKKDFDLILPNNKKIRCKICQAGGKALMSNPNKDLGKWILRSVLGLSKGEFLTYDKLQKLGVDSIRLEKLNKDTYKIDLASLGSYEDYLTKITVNPLLLSGGYKVS